MLIYTIYAILDILFCQITMFIKVSFAFSFGHQALESIDFTKKYQLKGLEPQKKITQTFMNVVI